MRDEIDADERALHAGRADWQDWWARTGERELRCVLMTAWDPIGVSDTVEAWDEYDNYLAGVARRLRDIADPDAAAQSVEEYLRHIERDYIGLETTIGSRETVSAALVAWHEWSFGHGGRPPHEWID
jgi:hypothetical protein